MNSVSAWAIMAIPAIYTGNAPLPFKSSVGRKVYFLASTSYANGAGELLQHSTVPCCPALAVKEGTSKELMSQDQPLQVCQMCSYELPLFLILFTSWDTCMLREPCYHCMFREMCLLPQYKKSYKQR